MTLRTFLAPISDSGNGKFKFSQFSVLGYFIWYFRCYLAVKGAVTDAQKQASDLHTGLFGVRCISLFGC